jgi:tetrapyrrole methylase family protein / MazG family protein
MTVGDSMEEFTKLVELMATLRGEKGCPWDKKQTVKAFKTFLLEEVYELLDAIERDNCKDIREELGDLLFHIIFISQICRERGFFDIRQVVADSYDKMYRRHPHVFSELSTQQNRSVEKQWEEIKKEEKEDYSLFANIPTTIPALLRAYIIAKRVARAKFNWKGIDALHEELLDQINKMRRAEDTGNIEEIRQQIGDALLTLVNIARSDGVDPEDALRLSTEKFTRTFTYPE